MTDIAALDDHELKVSDFYAVARRHARVLHLGRHGGHAAQPVPALERLRPHHTKPKAPDQPAGPGWPKLV